MRTITKMISGLLVGSIMMTGQTLAEDEGSPYGKYRHSVMEAMKGHISALSMLAFGQIDDTGFMQAHADALVEAGAELDSIFPEDSAEGSHALPEIWAQPDKFAMALEDYKTSSVAMQTAVQSGDRKAVAGAFKNLGNSCKGCHESFREEHDE